MPGNDCRLATHNCERHMQRRARQVYAVKRQLLFIQGGGAGAHDEWDNKLVESLRRELGPDYEIRYPRMPNECYPSCSLPEQIEQTSRMQI